jgi:CheY-like chemotaxis protein
LERLRFFASHAAIAIENARLFEEIEVGRRQLEVAGRHKSQFLANMSHELRTPLNAIIGYSEILQEEAEDLGQDDLVPDLQKITSAGRHLLELINAVLDLSKIDAGKMDLYVETVDVPRLVADAEAAVRPLALQYGNHLQVRCPAAVGAVEADLTKVRQALLSLLRNACTFTRGGTVSLEVHRTTSPAADGVTFLVQDTGIGLTREQLDTVFDEFTQVDQSSTRAAGGSGLGLALSRRLCRLMGGDVTATSRPGAGSTFAMHLPATAPAAAVPAPVRADRLAVAGDTATVLVIDDDRATRDLMERLLTREGMRVVTATGGAEGLRLAEQLRPAAITLDVLMPSLDGWAVLSALKATPGLADIPVILLTITDDRNLGYSLGAADYLSKPLDRDKLLAVLARHCRQASPPATSAIR